MSFPKVPKKAAAVLKEVWIETPLAHKVFFFSMIAMVVFLAIFEKEPAQPPFIFTLF